MSFFQNACRPRGFGGKIMLMMMNLGHSSMAAWGFSHIRPQPDAACLDIGCGGGANVRCLLKQCPRGKVSGIDYSDTSVEKAKSLNRSAIAQQRCQIVQGNVMELAFDDESFHLATAFETIYFWPDIEEAFKQVYGVLKSGAVFMICNELSGENPRDSKWTEKIVGMRIYTPGQIRAALAAAGFTAIQTDKNSKGWLCIVCRKPTAAEAG